MAARAGTRSGFVALAGRPNAGKSTLVNRLLGEERQLVGEVRADGSGRHTTTHRALIPVPGAGLVLDTPGMRELQLWTAPETADASFEDIEALAPGCHFTNCRHLTEPRCAVRAAVDDGTLAAARLESFHKLQDEARSLQERQDVRGRIVERAQGKVMSRAVKQFYRLRDRQ